MSRSVQDTADNTQPRPSDKNFSGSEQPPTNLNRLRGDMIAMVYHDIRSPLSTIVASLEMLSSVLSDNRPDTRAQSMIEIAQRSARRIQHLVDSLLDLDRLESGREIGSRAPASMQAILDEAVSQIKPVAEMKGVQVIQRTEPVLPPVDVDREMILRVVINLLENAVKFCRAQGTIRITLNTQDEVILTAIQDDGPGIPEDEQQLIFEKYGRPNILADGGGLGLGLAYCRLAVRSHGGDIWVESKPGDGAIFKFTLPAAG
jgi:signal transduction histidine kinase